MNEFNRVQELLRVFETVGFGRMFIIIYASLNSCFFSDELLCLSCTNVGKLLLSKLCCEPVLSLFVLT